MKYITCYMGSYKYELFSVSDLTGILEKVPQVQYSVSLFHAPLNRTSTNCPRTQRTA